MEASARRAYNYLFARQHGGDFILRIEDTDSHRFVPGAGAISWSRSNGAASRSTKASTREALTPRTARASARDLPEIRLATGRIGRAAVRFRHARRTERDPRGNRSSRQNVRVQLRSAHPAGRLAGPVGRRGQTPHRRGRPVGNPFQKCPKTRRCGCTT